MSRPREVLMFVGVLRAGVRSGDPITTPDVLDEGVVRGIAGQDMTVGTLIEIDEDGQVWPQPWMCRCGHAVDVHPVHGRTTLYYGACAEPGCRCALFDSAPEMLPRSTDELLADRQAEVQPSPIPPANAGGCHGAVADT